MMPALPKTMFQSNPTLQRRFRLGAVLLTLTLAPSITEAASGLYLQLGVGTGSFTGNQLVTQEDPNMDNDIPLTGDGCCPSAGPAGALRLGFSLFGYGGPEVLALASGWDIGSNLGGTGFFGGGVRVFPLKFIELGGLDMDGFPIDVGLGAIFGYTVVGKDFAYKGTFWNFDLSVAYMLSDYLSIGAQINVVRPSYDDFVFTDFKNDRGRCLDGSGNQVGGTPIDKGDAACSGSGPSTTFLSPQLTVTFHLDVFDI